MKAIVDLYWTFRSPYAYLATPGALQLERDFDIEVRLCPILPLSVRDPSVFNPGNTKPLSYIRMDWLRRAEMLGMPHAWPSPDPVAQDLNTLKIASEQPLIHRLTRLGVEAERRGHGIEFAFEVSHLIFGGTKDWHHGDLLAQATSRAGLDLIELDSTIADPGAHQAVIAANQRALSEAGHWGVPTFVFEHEPFFGQDRIDTLRWRLEKCGLKNPKSPFPHISRGINR